MPYSPYKKTIDVKQPIDKLDQYDRNFNDDREWFDDGGDLIVEKVLTDGEKLLEHSHFMEEKLGRERYKTIKLTKINQDFLKQIEKLKNESRIHKATAEELMSSLNGAKDNTPEIQKDVESTGNQKPSSFGSKTRKRSAEDVFTVNEGLVKKRKIDEGGEA